VAEAVPVEDPVLEVTDVSFAYGGHRVLDGVSFAVRPGEFVALAGPNGAGKSTLLRIILGLLTPASGAVRLLGVHPAAAGERWRVGYVPQRPAMSELLPATVTEIVAAGRLARRAWWRPPRQADADAIDAALHAVQLDDLRRRRFSELSGGQQQRALIAKAIVNDPNVLILDEPIAGVDTDSQLLFRDALATRAAAGTSVLLVSHELSAVAAELDRVLLLTHARIGFDGTAAALEQTGVSLGIHRNDLPFWLEDHG
jgi:zinc transport system ATP-binding protein